MGVIALLSTTLCAEEITLEPIVVGADFRAKKLSQTNAMSLLREEKIYDNASQSMENIIASTPNVNFTVGGSRAHYIQIRGIGERSQFETPVNPSVGLSVDGIDFSQSALGITMFDVQQIEVLKGPQGTTFGANGMAGVVNVKSNEPINESTRHLEATIGNYNTKAVGFVFNEPLVKDKVLGRFSIYKNKSDGFVKNTFLNKKNTQNINELSLKGQFKWFASDKHTIKLNLTHIDVNNGYDAFTLDNSRNSHADEVGKDTQNTNAFSLISTYQINSKMHLVSKVSHSTSQLDYFYDEDWTYAGEFADEGYSSVDKYLRKRVQTDFDVKFVSDERGRLFGLSDWTVGVYARNQQEDLIRDYTYAEGIFDNEYDTQNQAFYGQLDTHITKKLTLVTGIRVENWGADYKDSNAINLDTNEVLFGGKVGVNYQASPSNLYYVTLSKGFKAGGVNANSSLNAKDKNYDTEALWNADLGWNTSYLDSAIINRFNLFYGKRKSQQIKSSIALLREDKSTEFISYIGNAGEGSYYGLESEVNGYIGDNLHLFSSVGLLRSKFDSYTNVNPEALDLEGRTPAQSPKYQYSVGFDFTFLEDFTFSSSLEAKGSYYFSDSHNQKSDAYKLLHSNLTYNAQNWSANLWVRNITDESYQTRGFFFGNNPAKGYESELFTQQGDPRTFGLTLAYDF